MHMTAKNVVKWISCVALACLFCFSGVRLLAAGAKQKGPAKPTTMKDVQARCMALDAAVKSDDLDKIKKAAAGLNMCLARYKPSMESVGKEADFQNMCKMQMGALKKVGEATTAADAVKQVDEAKKSCGCCHAKYKKM